MKLFLEYFILAIVVGVLYVLYGGIATPSEASGVGAFLVFVMIAVVYKIYQPRKIWDIVKVSMKESVMIMFIICASYFFAFSLSTLYVTQSIAQLIVDLSLNKWVLFLHKYILVNSRFLFTSSCSNSYDISNFVADNY